MSKIEEKEHTWMTVLTETAASTNNLSVAFPFESVTWTDLKHNLARAMGVD